jgi:hypothetical protein
MTVREIEDLRLSLMVAVEDLYQAERSFIEAERHRATARSKLAALHSRAIEALKESAK